MKARRAAVGLLRSDRSLTHLLSRVTESGRTPISIERVGRDRERADWSGGAEVRLIVGVYAAGPVLAHPGHLANTASRHGVGRRARARAGGEFRTGAFMPPRR